MSHSRTSTGLALAAAALLNPAFAADTVRLPPSVGATPIEIPMIDPDAPLVMQGQGTGRTSATPIEIPRINPDVPFVMMPQSAISALPVPLPSPNIEQLDPRRHASAFDVQPLPMFGTARVGNMGRFSYALLTDNTVYGDTNFGYARFGSVSDYRRFLQSH